MTDLEKKLLKALADLCDNAFTDYSGEFFIDCVDSEALVRAKQILEQERVRLMMKIPAFPIKSK